MNTYDNPARTKKYKINKLIINIYEYSIGNKLLNP